VSHCQLALLLDGAEHAGHLLNGVALDVEQGFDGDHDLCEVIRYNLQHLSHNLSIGDVVAEKTQLGGEPGDAVHEILCVLHLLTHQGAKVTPNLLCVRLAYALDSDANLLDHLSRRCHHRPPLPKARQHVWQH
jgi:hypothetical protein